MPAQKIVTVGASAGGLRPLTEILSGVPPDFPASLFVVLHLAPYSSSELAEILDRRSPLKVKWAEDQEAVQAGVVYVAPANHHLLLSQGPVRVLFGARESGSRPSIDVLFRSAAVAYGSQAVGVILSGTLDDGARGLLAIKRCGGTTVVQDPDSATEPEMPRNALREVDADHCVASDAIAPLLQELVERQLPLRMAVPRDIELENRVALSSMTVSDDTPAGDAAMVSCPDCGGQLRRFEGGRGDQYRCYVGHAYSSQLLLDRQREQLEQAMWIAVRVIGDRKRVLDRLAEDYWKRGMSQMADSMTGRASELAEQASLLREVLGKISMPEPTIDEPDLSAAN